MPLKLHAALRLEDDRLRDNELGIWKTRGDILRREVANLARAANNRRPYGRARVRAQDSHRPIVAGDGGRCLNAGAASQRGRRPACNRNLPDVAKVDIVLVGRVDDGLTIGTEGCALQLKVPWGQECGRPTLRENGI